jgi:hypothetical protein
MAAPIEIIDALQSILDIFFSGVRHRERAAFILADNLDEMVCKTKAKQHDHNFNMRCTFFDAWNANGVALAPNGLGRRINGYRDTRNNMQHASAASTVDTQHCATVILDTVKVIDHCWHNTSRIQFPTWIKCALRVIRLYSSEGDITKHRRFEDKMRSINWRGSQKEYVKPNAIQVEPGMRDFWGMMIRTRPELVEECLNDLEIP